jgi:hypothetical protein
MAALNGTITGREYRDFILGAKAGQVMSVSLADDGTGNSTDRHSVNFNILPPGSTGVAIYNSSTSGHNAQVKLPKNGDYKIRVYLMGEAKDANHTVPFTISVRITDGSNVSDSKVPGTNYNATGNIPCSMGNGQPTTNCPFGVVRRGNGSADVTVTKPDGRKRVIFFESGKATGYDASQADRGQFNATKDTDLFIIRIGKERYEIPEIVVFGD